jgi:hypothetical protein
MDSAKKKYQEFCKDSNRPLIFQTPQWLDAVAGNDNWDVALTFNGNLLSGAMPFVTNSKLGLKQITLPFLTPYLGPIVIYPADLKLENQLSFKRKVITSLVNQIPKVDRFITQTDFDFDYWLPFSWEDYQQTTRYTYLLNTSIPEKELTAKFKPNIKKHIKKSTEIFTVVEASNVDMVFTLHETDLKNKGVDLLFSKQQLIHLDEAVMENRKILHAVNDSGEIVCAFYLVFDEQYAHYLIGAVKDEFRNSGVMSLLMWESIKEAKKRNLTFNFEGSMNKNIERFFASFGGQLTPFMKISKTSNKWLKQFTRFNH